MIKINGNNNLVIKQINKFMKTINTYINEKLRLTNKRTYTCQPKNKYELRKIIIERIKDEGNECDLNDIDVSKITDMSWLFDASTYKIFKDFNVDVSMWDMSNAKYMDGMFIRCTKFNCDISKWKVSNVDNIKYMFYECKKFNQDLNKWDVSNVKYMHFIIAKHNQHGIMKITKNNIKYNGVNKL